MSGSSISISTTSYNSSNMTSSSSSSSPNPSYSSSSFCSADSRLSVYSPSSSKMISFVYLYMSSILLFEFFSAVIFYKTSSRLRTNSLYSSFFARFNRYSPSFSFSRCKTLISFSRSLAAYISCFLASSWATFCFYSCILSLSI